MSKFFADVDDSTDDEGERSEVAEDENAQAQESDEEQNSKWFVQDSGDESGSEAEEGPQGVRSKKAKALERIQDLADKLEFQIDSSWKDSQMLFEEILEKSAEYIKKHAEKPAPFLSCIQMLLAVLNAHKEKPLSKEDFETKEEHSAYNKLVKKIEECATRFGDDLERQKRQEAGDEERPVEQSPAATEEQTGGSKEWADWTPEGMLELLRSEQPKVSPKLRVTNYENLVSHAKQQGLVQFVVCGLAQHASTVLANEQDRSHHSFPSWKVAFELVRESFATFQSAPRLLLLENLQFDKISPTATTVTSYALLIGDLYERYVSGLQFLDRQKQLDLILVRVRQENSFLRLVKDVLQFYRQRGTKKSIAQLATIALDIVHSRRTENHAVLEGPTANLPAEVEEYYSLILANAAQDSQRAVLQYAYHLALHNHFNKARDLLFQSKLSEPKDVAARNQVPFNRVVAQLGLAAFRLGLYPECNVVLMDLCSYKSKEIGFLLGQVILPPPPGKSDTEVMELELFHRSRLSLFHRQVPLELLESVSLVAAMLAAVVTEAKKPYERNSRQKNFAYLVSQHHHSLLTGPPSNFRESVVFTFNAMGRGDAQAALALTQHAVWDALGAHKADAIAKLAKQISEDCLRVFLLRHGANYASIAVSHLSDKFAVPTDRVRTLVSQLLLDRDNVITGFWDDREGALIVERGPPSRLHYLAELASERLTQIAGGQQTRVFDRRAGRRQPYRRPA